MGYIQLKKHLNMRKNNRVERSADKLLVLLFWGKGGILQVIGNLQEKKIWNLQKKQQNF